MIAGKFPLAVVVAVVGLLLAVTVAVTSARDHPPRYHKVYHKPLRSVIYLHVIYQRKTCMNS